VVWVAFDVRTELRERWEGNRRLTLRVARAFPADKLCTYAPVAPLRPFGSMLDEIARVELAYLRGLTEDRWDYNPQEPPPATDAAGAIAFLEEITAYTRGAWDALDSAALEARRQDPFFFGDSLRPFDWLCYCAENETHHRGQGYTYLRLLGIEPPKFWER